MGGITPALPPVLTPVTYTPTVSSNNGTITSFTVNQAEYFLIATKVCFINLDISITTAGTANGNTLLCTLPFNTGSVYAVLMGRDQGAPSFILAQAAPASNTLAVVNPGNTGVIANGARFILSGTFKTA